MRKSDFDNARILVFFLLILSFVLSVHAETEKRIGFGFGVNYLQGSDSRFSGNGNFFLLTFRLNKDINVSLLREEFKLGGSGTSLIGTKREIDVDATIVGLRICRRITNLLNIGIDLGNANFSNAIVDSTIMAGIIISSTALETQNDLMDTKLDIDLGYKILNINNSDPFDNLNKKVKDLNVFFIGLNLKIIF